MTGILHVIREFKKIPVKNTIVREGLEAEVQETVEVSLLCCSTFLTSSRTSCLINESDPISITVHYSLFCSSWGDKIL